MTPVWAQRQADLLRDCLVSPAVFQHMVDRLRDFAVPYQHALEPEAGQRNVALYLAGLLSHLQRKNVEQIAALVDVERLVMQDFIGTALWDHRPLLAVLVGQVVEWLGEPDGIIAFDPSSFPKRGTHSVGVKRQWCGHRGKIDDLETSIAPFSECYPPFPRLVKALSALRTYIGNNRHLIPNYGERYRNGEPIATGFVESTVNEVVSKRFCKKQQMQWSKEGAHLLLQTRVRTLNGELADIFKRWYPDLDMKTEEIPIVA